MTDIYRVLVFPGGTEIGLEINRALRYARNITLFSAGSNVSNHAPYVFENHFIIPSIHEKGWVDALNKILFQNGIDFIYPAYDDVLLALKEFEDQIRARVVTSPLETCRVTRSKSATYGLLADKIPTPVLYGSVEAVERFPVFAKPDRGQGSEGTIVIDGKAEFSAVRRRYPGHILMEYLVGEEYTVDCFSDREAGLLYVGGRKRVRTKHGVSVASEPVDDEVFLRYAKTISDSLEFHGAWFFQLKKDSQGVYKLLEIAPRIAGTMALHRVSGINFPLLSIYEQARIPVAIKPNRVSVSIDRCLLNSYKHDISYNFIYVDLDDTLVIKDKVNTLLIRFLFQALNAGKRIILITRAQDDFHNRLRRLRISELFDSILRVNSEQDKAALISHRDAIFIDDSFRERMFVTEKTGMPTFDCSMIEMLVDERSL